jgi:hypothetical protein
VQTIASLANSFALGKEVVLWTITLLGLVLFHRFLNIVIQSRAPSARKNENGLTAN